jgi:O-antigen ligase
VIAMTLVLLVIATLPREIRLPLLAIGVVVVPVISLDSYNLITHMNRSFKVNMGSVDNSEYREEKWAMAMRDFHRAPVFGKFFAGAGEYDHRLAHRYNHGTSPEDIGDIDAVPLHNDYLEFLVDGGLVGVGLFTTGLIGCVGLGLKNYVAFERRTMSDFASLSLIMSITLITAMQAIAVNPVMNESPCGFFVYLAAALIIVVDRYQTHSSAMARRASGLRSTEVVVS